MRTLKDLAPGEQSIITRINGSGLIRKRLIDMGVMPGTTVVMERMAPLGDPIEVKINYNHLSLRKDEAQQIVVEKD